MRKDVADFRYRQLEGTKLSKHCPLSHEFCRNDCECYERGGVFDHEEDGKPYEYHVVGPTCTCYVLHGA